MSPLLTCGTSLQYTVVYTDTYLSLFGITDFITFFVIHCLMKNDSLSKVVLLALFSFFLKASQQWVSTVPFYIYVDFFFFYRFQCLQNCRTPTTCSKGLAINPTHSQ